MMLYNIAYTEDNAPDYDAMTHQVLIQVENDNEDIIPVLSLFEEVKEAKAKMDNPDEDDDPIYAEYEDEGWHEKIDAAWDIVLGKHSDLGAKRITEDNLRTYSTYIN